MSLAASPRYLKPYNMVESPTARVGPGRVSHLAQPSYCRVRSIQSMVVAATDDAMLSRSYNEMMKASMSNPYEYDFDRGLYYQEIVPDIIAGTQPRDRDEFQHLRANEGVTTILNLQQMHDGDHWGIDIGRNASHARDLGLNWINTPVQDFSEDSLRQELPKAVKALSCSARNGERVYVHCTAGLGRAPAVIIAYLYWFSEEAALQGLEEAHDHLVALRPCGPRKNAIRGATYDLCSDYGGDFHNMPPHAFNHMSAQERELVQKRVHEWF